MKNRLVFICMAILCVSLLCGCSNSGDMTLITADASGGITEKIIEPLDHEEFTKEELEAYITAQTEAYKGGAVTMESCKINGQKVEIVMKYPSWQDYADFNQVVCFQGTLAEASEAGYDMNQSWREPSGKVAEMEPIRERQDEWKVFILEEPVRVRMPDKILYTSDNVTVTGRLNARVDTVMTESSAAAVSETEQKEEKEASEEASSSQEAGSGEVSLEAEMPPEINRYATVADRYAYIIYK